MILDHLIISSLCYLCQCILISTGVEWILQITEFSRNTLQDRAACFFLSLEVLLALCIISEWFNTS